MVYPYIFIDSSSLVNVSHKNSVSLRVLNTYSLTLFINCNSDSSVQIDINIGNTCSLRQTNVLNEILRLIQNFQTLFRHHNSFQSCFSVFAYLCKLCRFQRKSQC